MKKIKLLLTLVLMALVMTSCEFGGNKIPTDAITQSRDHQFYVKSINIIDYDDVGLCRYTITTGREYIGYDDHITVVDSIGKFNIGQAVEIRFCAIE